MVANCSTFIDLTTCSLTLTNLYNIKLSTLTILLIYSGLLFYLINDLDSKWKEKSYMHYWAFWIGKVLSIGYIVFSPLLYTLLLDHSINLEIFLIIIVALYFMMLAVFLGMVIYGGNSHIFKMFGFDDWNELKDTRADSKSMKKYG